MAGSRSPGRGWFGGTGGAAMVVEVTTEVVGSDVSLGDVVVAGDVGWTTASVKTSLQNRGSPPVDARHTCRRRSRRRSQGRLVVEVVAGLHRADEAGDGQQVHRPVVPRPSAAGSALGPVPALAVVWWSEMQQS